MSQRRNNFLGPLSARHTGVVAVVVAGAAACSSERVSGPAAQPAVAAAPQAAVYSSGPGEKDAALRLDDVALTVLAPVWHTTAADILAPTTKPLDLACGVQGVFVVSQRIGRSGGTLKFGRSELRIPSGALSTDTQISATIRLGQGVDVEFQPHGLQFAKAAELRVDYTGCEAPALAPINMYYTNEAGFVTQVMPSSSSKGSKSVRMLTDHFSGYTVSWGRR